MPASENGPCADALSAEELDEILALIYQGPLESEPWKPFLRHLRQRLGCEVAAISLRPARGGALPLVVWSRREHLVGRDARSAAEEHARLAHLDPLGNALARPGDIYTLDEVVPREQLVHGEFYVRLMQPYGIEYQLGMYLAEPGGWQCHLGLMNGPEGRDFGAREKAFLVRFRPHLERALELFARIRRNESEKEILEETLDRLAIGTIVLDGHGHAVSVNRTAQELARRSGALKIVHQRIVLARPEQAALLREMIERALAPRRSGKAGAFVDALRIAAPGGDALGLLIRSAGADDPYWSETTPAAIIYLRDPAPLPLAPERFVAQLFGLTPAEASLATRVANGAALAEAAAHLGISEQTARSYMKRVFSKTGVGRQTELVMLILKSVALLG